LTIENQEDIEGLHRIGSIVARVLHEMLSSAQPGMTTLELDAIGERMLEQFGARSAPRITYGFPGATCISVNEQAAHGIPGHRVLREGDVVNVDVSAELAGYFADTGGTTVLPPSTATKMRLCHAARTALSNALSYEPVDRSTVSAQP
jgi:methionyl aminopeptidase